MKPWHETDPYAFKWPQLSGQKAQEFMLSLADLLMGKTPRERVNYIEAILPDLRRPTKEVSAFDQHLVITALMTWCEDNREKIQ